MNEYEDIKGYEGLYKINREGDVFSIISNRVLKPCATTGYKCIGLSKNKQVKHYKVHRLLAIQYLENPENKRCVDHIDRNRQNNCLDNLRWATDAENSSNISVKGYICMRNDRNTFQVKYHYEPKKVMSKCFKTRAEAEAYLEELKIKYPR